MVVSLTRRRRRVLIASAAIASASLVLIPDVAAAGRIAAQDATAGTAATAATARTATTATTATTEPRREEGTDVGTGWVWPLAGPRRVLQAYHAPPSRYEAGHRGIDLPAVGGTDVVSPADGIVRFAGVVVDRPVLTVETRDGTLISLEPLASALRAGDIVDRAKPLGRVADGGHCGAECLHLGVRVDGEYVSPLRFFGGVPRAVLLPLR
jgi:septal ring factor EnvC (AmiA/AmiB activator)